MVLVVLEIKDLLQSQGYTIEGAKTKLDNPSTSQQSNETSGQIVKQLKNDLEQLLVLLNK